MTPVLPLPPNAIAHQEDAVHGMRDVKKLDPKPVTKAPPKDTELTPSELSFHAGNVALSFAYDSQAKSLNIVMTDKVSGEVVRKMSFKHLASDVHQASKLHGLLLDQRA